MALDAKTDSGRISRRTIIKGAAWSAPVMIAAVAVPAAVASTPPTSVTPASSTLTSATTTVVYTLDPAPAAGTVVTLGVSGSGYTFSNGQTTASATVGGSGQFSVTINAGPGTGTLSISGETWGPLTSSLSFSAPTTLTRSPAGALAGGANTVTFTLNSAFSGSVVLTISNTGNANRHFGFNPDRTVASTTVLFTNGTAAVTVYAPTAAGASQTLTATTASPALFSLTNTLTH